MKGVVKKLETKEYYGGTYPEPSEPKEKCYGVGAECSCYVLYVVYATSKEEAIESVKNGNYEERYFDDVTIEEIVDCGEYEKC